MKYNVYAVVGGKPLARQNAKPLSANRAKVLADNLRLGRAKSPRVLVTKAGELKAKQQNA